MTKMKILLVLLSLLLVSSALSGCIQQNSTNDPGDTGPEFAEAPHFIVEATVVFLSLDDNVACEGICPAYEYPIDTGIIRIDNLSFEDDAPMSLEGIEEGENLSIRFGFSARPTKIRRTPSANQTTSDLPDIPTSGRPAFADPVHKEDGYFVYVFESTLVTVETETVLPGLDVGSRFTATVWYGDGVIQDSAVGEYELLP